MKRVRIYKRFEIFWHWAQALLVLLLALTGFDLRFRFFELFGFEASVEAHKICAWAFMVLIVFAIFWHFTTGEWKQYLPTRKYLKAMIRFYLVGIFEGAPHPVKKTVLSKLNPLQRLAYLGLKLLLIPVLVTSGLAYFFYNDWESIGLAWLELGWVARIHVLGAYLLIAFVIGHIYLTTTGRSPRANMKAMVTGWEELEEED